MNFNLVHEHNNLNVFPPFNLPVLGFAAAYHLLSSCLSIEARLPIISAPKAPNFGGWSTQNGHLYVKGSSSICSLFTLYVVGWSSICSLFTLYVAGWLYMQKSTLYMSTYSPLYARQATYRGEVPTYRGQPLQQFTKYKVGSKPRNLLLVRDRMIEGEIFVDRIYDCLSFDN